MASLSPRLRGFYPEIGPSADGHLEVGDGHRIYYAEYGNKKGVPVVYLHGGPGSCCKPKHARFFNPKKYRIILFDQRGCGRSTPYASLRRNTTPHLVADMEKLRTHLGVDKWIVFGGSWGSTLAMAYVAQYARHVRGVVMYGIFLGRKLEMDAFVKPHGVAAQIHPEAHAEFLSLLTPAERKNPLKSYARLIADGKNKRHKKALRYWLNWESTLYMMGKITMDEVKGFTEEMDRLGLLKSMALLETHYMSHGCFIDADKILAKLKTLKNVPCHIFQGRYDLVCPPQTAWDVHQAWKGSTLRFIEGEGHANDGPQMLDALIGATDGLAKKPPPRKR